jgi:hypothetical protein
MAVSDSCSVEDDSGVLHPQRFAAPGRILLGLTNPTSPLRDMLNYSLHSVTSQKTRILDIGDVSNSHCLWYVIEQMKCLSRELCTRWHNVFC